MLSDLRSALRSLSKSPAFVAVAVLTLALGIGVNTAIFSIVNAVLIQPPPLGDPGRLVLVWETNLAQGFEQFSTAPGNWLDWRNRNRVFEGMTAWSTQPVALTGGGEPEQVGAVAATGAFFPLLRTNAALGRVFGPVDDQPGQPPVAVISHGLWTRRYGADSSLVGRTVPIDGRARTVIGVLPEEFAFPDAAVDVWTPLQLEATFDRATNRGGRFLVTLGRLRPGVSLDRAQSDMSRIAAELEPEFGSWSAGWGVKLVGLQDHLVRSVRPALLVLAGVVALVLLIACGNVANLSLVRATARGREIALRAALGAGLGRLVRQLLAESLVLGIAGAAVGLLVANWAVSAFAGIAPVAGRVADGMIDVDVLAFTLLLALLTGVGFGLAPIWWLRGQDLRRALNERLLGGSSGGRRAGTLRTGLVVAQVSLSLVLLVGAGLLLRSFWQVLAVDPGFRPQNVLTLRITLPEARYAEESLALAFTEQLFDELRTVPGVAAVGATHALPLSGRNSSRPFLIAGTPAPEPGREPAADYRVVTAGYFAAMGIPIVRGRVFSSQDDGAAPPVVVINETMARRYWPGEDPVGREVTIGGYLDLWGHVIGVVADVRHAGLDVASAPQMYWLASQSWLERGRTLRLWRRDFTVAIRTVSDPLVLIPAARRAVHAVDPNQPVSDVRTMEQFLNASTSQRRWQMSLVTAFALLAMTLAVIGVYGVVAQVVQERTREMGIRAALGASRSKVLALVLGRGARLIGAGVILGIGAGLGATRVLSSFLFDIEPADPLTFAISATVLGAAALLACYVPARRAARVDPMIALREQ